jgi:Terminase RNaseH-like domain
MAAKSGKEHHNVAKLQEAKAKVLEFISQGLDLQDALARAGRKPDVMKDWRKDPKFVKELEAARQEGERTLSIVTGDAKYKIGFEQFSAEFLDSPIFPHHRSWIDVLEGREPSWLHPAMTYEPSSPKRLLINVPPEHAKSTVITVNYCVYRIAMDPNVKITIVSKTQERAKEYLYSIKQRLSHERWAKLQAVYGSAGGWKEDADTWKADRIYLSRNSTEKDPTVQALGIGGQITGARSNLIILDDVVTTSNAHEWEKQLLWLQRDVVTRLGDNGKLLIVGTRIASNDLYREIRNGAHWSNGKTPFTYFAMPAVLELDEDPANWVTLWAKSHIPWEGSEDDVLPDENGLYPKWDGPALFRRRSEVSASAWALVYQQQDVQEDSIFAPACVQGSVNRMRKRGPLKPGVPGHPRERGSWYTIMGLDPAMTGNTAAVVMTVDRNTRKRYVLDVVNMVDPTPAKIRDLIGDWVEKYQPQELRIEINAHQKAYALDDELRSFLASTGVRFSSQFTGKNKWDTSFGVAAMSGLFGTVRNGAHQDDNLIELPSQDGSEGIKALIQQLITWKPDTKGKTDCVMALWFCELRAKEVIGSANFNQSHVVNRWATRKQLDQRYVMNISDYEMSMYE